MRTYTGRRAVSRLIRNIDTRFSYTFCLPLLDGNLDGHLNQSGRFGKEKKSILHLTEIEPQHFNSGLVSMLIPAYRLQCKNVQVLLK